MIEAQEVCDLCVWEGKPLMSLFWEYEHEHESRMEQSFASGYAQTNNSCRVIMKL